MSFENSEQPMLRLLQKVLFRQNFPEASLRLWNILPMYTKNKNINLGGNDGHSNGSVSCLFYFCRYRSCCSGVAGRRLHTRKAKKETYQEDARRLEAR